MSTCEHLHIACFERKPLKKNRKGKETIQLHSTVKTSCEFNLTRYTGPAVFKRVYLSVHSSPLPTICRRSLTKERDKLFRRSWGKMWRYNMAQLTDKPPTEVKQEGIGPAPAGVRRQHHWCNFPACARQHVDRLVQKDEQGCVVTVQGRLISEESFFHDVFSPVMCNSWDLKENVRPQRVHF